VRVAPAHPALGEFSPEAIAHVKDLNARTTLEQAHALALGLVEVLLAEGSGANSTDLALKLGSLGISLDAAEQIASEGVALIEMIAERDRKAELFHAAVMAASESERVLYERISSYARLLRSKLGPRDPALDQFGVPPDSADTLRCYKRAARPEPTAPTAPLPPKCITR
jgi:hypothetical protein